MHLIHIEIKTIFGETWVGTKRVEYGRLSGYLRAMPKAIKRTGFILTITIKDDKDNILGTFERS